ncbi:hypothetical protein PENTCL1PPCAC_2830 [Pristionchus entomophagus]|uniref:Uncharacterized protein n=1 Tax=Pristionchus entomophagus TaxID=358040 RepID=A0AAV5SKJ8_9BILA|nr:hypothetical protein PENTCL1PPCAC_2830 [Pristionchus entomophagus]
MKHPGDVAFTDRTVSDYFPMPGISLILASLIWIVFVFYFVAMLKDHCHRVKEMRRLEKLRNPTRTDLVDNKQLSLRNSLRNPLLSAKEEKKEVKPSKENLSKEELPTPEKGSAERTDKTDKNANPSAENVTPSKEALKDGEGGDIKPSAEITNRPEKSNPPSENVTETGSGGLKPSAEVVKEPKSDDAAMTYSEMIKKEKKPSAETFKDTPEGRAKQSAAKKTWQQVQHKRSAEIIEEKWRQKNLGGKKPTAATNHPSKEPLPDKPKKKEYCASSENIVVTASAENT